MRFWLAELRTPELLLEQSVLHPALGGRLIEARPLLALAREGRAADLAAALAEEEAAERERDRLYWLPLRREIEEMRRRR